MSESGSDPQDSELSPGEAEEGDERREFHLHLISDATGETVSAVARACLAQFPEADPIEHVWSLVRTPGQIDRVIAGIDLNPGVVLFTIVDQDLRVRLQEACRTLGVPCISVLEPVMGALASYLRRDSMGRPGRQHALDSDYFNRIDAMEFALSHDDGQLAQGMGQADVVIVGVSRTSKTPTCLYLANRGLKAANVPIVPGCPLPEVLMTTIRPLVVGLTKDPRSLVEIRRNRLRELHGGDQRTDYVDEERVAEEVREAKRLCAKMGWPLIDVTRRSVEETAAAIHQLFLAHVAERRSQEPA